MIWRDGNDVAHPIALDVTGPTTARVTIGEWSAELTVSALGPGHFRLSDGERSWRVWVDRDGAARRVTVEGVGEATLEKEGKSRRRRRETPQGSLSSPMPGTVVKVLVAEGDTVEKGQDLLIVEAMKMEIKVSAPLPGTVKTIHVAEGSGCDAGETLVSIDPAETSR